MDTVERVAKPQKTKKTKTAKDLAPTTESGRIKMLEDLLATNRTAAEGWRQVADKKQMKIDDQALMLDQQAPQIETLRRRLEEATAFIDNLAGVKPKQKQAT